MENNDSSVWNRSLGRQRSLPNFEKNRFCFLKALINIFIGHKKAGAPDILDTLSTWLLFLYSSQFEFLCSAQALVDKELLSDETFIYPVGIEMYSTNGDHLPLPPGRRKDLDQHFYGEQLESDDYLHQGYERDPLYKLPLMARMQANIYKHRSDSRKVTET